MPPPPPETRREPKRVWLPIQSLVKVQSGAHTAGISNHGQENRLEPRHASRVNGRRQLKSAATPNPMSRPAVLRLARVAAHRPVPSDVGRYLTLLCGRISKGICNGRRTKTPTAKTADMTDNKIDRLPLLSQVNVLFLFMLISGPLIIVLVSLLLVPG